MTDQPTSGRSLEELGAELTFLFQKDAAIRLADTVAVTLYESGRSAARRSLRALFTDDADDRDALLFAGLALEHMAKWHLATIHPVLIADGEFESLLLMTGNGNRIVGTPTLATARTISATAACQRVAALEGARWSYAKKADEVVFHSRNAVAHLAWVPDQETVRKSLRIMVRLVDSLRALPQTGVESEEEFWGESRSIAKTLEAENVSYTEMVLAAKVADARSTFERRVPAALSKDERAVVVAAIASRNRYEGHASVLRPCPACGELGHVQYETMRDDWGDRFALPVGFDCSACELDLEVDEVTLLSLGDDIELESA